MVLPGLSDLRVDYPVYLYPPRILQSAHDRFMELSSRRVMGRVMAELRPDCVLSYWAHPDGEVAARFAHAARIPAGVIVGGSDVATELQKATAAFQPVLDKSNEA